MSRLSNKVCKFPKCEKEVPGEKGVFCSYHKKSVTEAGKAVGKGTIAIASVAGATVLAVIGKKN